VIVEREAQAILDHLDRRDGDSRAWRTKAGIVTAVAVVSADDAAEIREKWIALLEPYIARAEGLEPRPGQRYARYFMAATPLPELGGEGSEHGSDD
jgi:hypothetical protein